jgi:drug/metabolite transporter (DMT)-like permease
MNAYDLTSLIHTTLAVAFVFPLIGVVSYFAWQTRQRRLQTGDRPKSKIPPSVGGEHVKLGRWLTASVVIVALIGLAHPIFWTMSANQTWTANPFQAFFIVAIFVGTLLSLALLFKARTRLWRGIFASLTGMGLVILGFQEGVFRRDFEWYVSHYYYGVAAAMLMLFAQAIAPDIYQDRQNRWRTVHIVLNSIALLLFIGQGFTGTRDLLEIPLAWQRPYVEQLYWYDCRNAPADNPCAVQPPAAPEQEPAPQ